MLDFANLYFDEDQLPPGQPFIHTTGVMYFSTFTTFLRESKAITGYSMMGVATGRAGIGKSMAIQAFVADLPPQPHTGLPDSIVVRVKDRASPGSIGEDVLSCLGERRPPSRANANTIANEAARALLAHDIHLLFADDADHLNECGFELLRYLHAKTGCPIAIVGLPAILPIVDRYEKFSSRMVLRLNFPLLTEDEVLSTILPQLVFPRWTYDPANAQHLEMGRDLWRHSYPSFRDLRKILQCACLVATYQNEETITQAILNDTYQILRTPRNTDQNSVSAEESHAQTAFEYASYQRQERRRKTAGKGNS